MGRNGVGRIGDDVTVGVPYMDKVLNQQAEIERLTAEVARLVGANELWHLRVSQLNTSLSASTDRVEELQAEVASLNADIAILRQNATVRRVEELEDRLKAHELLAGEVPITLAAAKTVIANIRKLKESPDGT